MYFTRYCWAAVATLVPFLIMFVYCHPSVDDYAIAEIVGEHGFWGGQSHIYQLWAGRYTANALLMAAGINPDLAARLVPILLFLLFPLSMWRFIHVSWSLLHNQACRDRDEQGISSSASNRRIGPLALDSTGRSPHKPMLQALTEPTLKHSLWLSLIATAFYVARAPSVAQAFYWWSGSLTYTIGLCLTLLLFAALVSHSKSTSPANRVGSAILCGLLTAAAVGSNETIMALIDASLLLVCVVLFHKRSRHLPIWAGVLMVAFVGSLFDYYAPGTQTRMAAMPDGHQIVHSITHSLFHTAKYLAIWTTDPALWCASIIAVPFLLSLYRNLRNRPGVSLPRPPVVYFFWFLAHYATVFPAYWAMGHGPPHRVQNITYMVFLIGWSISFFVLIGNASEVWLTRLSQPKLRLRAAMGFAICLPLIGNFPIAVYDVVYAAPRYHRDWIERHESLIHHAKHGSRHISVRPFEAHPKTIFHGDITDDAAEWTNQAYASYYGLESVELKSTPIAESGTKRRATESADGKVFKPASRTPVFRSARDSRSERR